jgi:recombination associated protein RdgC
MRIFAEDPPAQFALGREARMRDRSEVKSQVRWQDVDLTQATVRKCIKDGMELTHLGIEFGGALSAVLDSAGSLGKLKLLGLEEPGRRTRRKLKEQTRDELLPKALLKSDRTLGLYIIPENVLAVGTGSESKAERFVEHLRAALGKLDVKPLSFSRSVEHVLMRIFAEDPPAQFALGREARMRDRAEAKSSVRWSEVDLTHANVRRCVKDGMELTHLGIHFDGALSAVLDSTGALGKLKLVGLDEAADEAAEGAELAEDPLARLDAELALFGGTLRELVAGLKHALDA